MMFWVVVMQLKRQHKNDELLLTNPRIIALTAQSKIFSTLPYYHASDTKTVRITAISQQILYLSVCTETTRQQQRKNIGL